MVGSSYHRTIYGFEIETSPEQDARLIRKLNRRPNRERYNFVKRNCADFVRELINFYYPHALHRSIIGDLGVTTPKQIAKMIVRDANHHHPELEGADLLLPQIPGTLRRSKPIHGVLESVMASKKYMLPIVVLHPYIGGGLLVEYFGHRRFDPAKNALVLDSDDALNTPMTRDQRVRYQSRLDEMTRSAFVVDPVSQATTEGTAEPKAVLKTDGKGDAKGKEVKIWEHLQAAATPGIDTSGQPVLQVRSGDDLAQVGISRANILSVSDSSEFAAKLVEARLREELRPATAKKTSPSEVEKDLALLQYLLSLQPKAVAVTPVSTKDKPIQADLQ